MKNSGDCWRMCGGPYISYLRMMKCSEAHKTLPTMKWNPRHFRRTGAKSMLGTRNWWRALNIFCLTEDFLSRSPRIWLWNSGIQYRKLGGATTLRIKGINSVRLSTFQTRDTDDTFYYTGFQGFGSNTASNPTNSIWIYNPLFSTFRYNFPKHRNS